VNLTYPGEFELTGSPWDWFRTLRQSQQACHQAYMEFEDLTVLSASPELFFRHADGKILCRPMKGTASPQQMDMLRSSAKDRAENIMIVDMIRNDLGKCAPAGKVLTQSLMDIEHYPSVLQMTSTVSAEGSADVLAWLKALFPCASITGAPKTKTMEWITRLEHAPRGIYTGAIGGFFADGISEFNVAIRTAVHRPATGWVRYHTGCGIVWDSDPEAEYEESLLKTAVLTHRTPPMQLLETMRTDPETGIQHLHRHIDRMRHSAACLGFEWNEDDLRNQLLIKATVFTEAQKVRVLLSPDGHFEVSLFPLPPSTPMRFSVDTEPTPSTHPDLKHKTTHREVYIQARNRCPDVDETLLLNERGELMEFTIGNLVVEHAGTFWTPPLQSGLLPGTARAEWLQNETLQEKTLTPADLETADGIYLLNDVRGLVPMDWVRDAEPVRVTGPLVDVSARHQNQEEGSDRSDQ
jgi:para-aminobenzoate synthetase/4-amino-4-deoxychorismate lyase